jgi:hypothetical protein
MSKQGMGMVKGRGMLQGRGMLGWSWALVTVIARVVVASSHVLVVASSLSSRVLVVFASSLSWCVIFVCRPGRVVVGLCFLVVVFARVVVASSLSWCVLAVSLRVLAVSLRFVFARVVVASSLSWRVLAASWRVLVLWSVVVPVLCSPGRS